MYEMERSGLIVSRGTEGKTITEDTARIESIRQDLARQTLEAFYREMGRLGYTREESLRLAEEYSRRQAERSEDLRDNIILQCRDLSKSYGGKMALDHVNLEVFSGRIVGLLGPNGSGKTTLIKLANGLLAPTSGEIRINGYRPGIETKRIVSYLPDKEYLNNWMRVGDLAEFFSEFYSDFREQRALEMLTHLNISTGDKLKNLSKGNKEKVQLILVMSREAKLYLLDQPIGGVDPAAREYILRTIIGNYNPDAAVLISTHLIADVEPVLDDVIFIDRGHIALTASVDYIREEKGKSVDALFREVFRC